MKINPMKLPMLEFIRFLAIKVYFHMFSAMSVKLKKVYIKCNKHIKPIFLKRGLLIKKEPMERQGERRRKKK